jgi:hypothetical protein
VSRSVRVTESVLHQALKERFERRNLSPAAEFGQESANDDEPPGCAVPVEDGGTCAQPGVLADPQTGRYRCLYHVHTLGDVS